MKPFIKKFTVDGSFYIYDVNSNRIFNVDKLTYDVINDVYLKTDKVITKFRKTYPEDVIKNKLDELKKLIDKNSYFTHNTLNNNLKLEFSIGEIKELLDNKVKSIALGVTEDCNMRCRYCIYSGKIGYKRSHSKKFMDFDTAQKSIDFFFEHNKKVTDKIGISFYGGEPLLNFKLIKDCVNYSRAKNTKLDRKLIFSITTNGTLLDDEIIDFIVKEKIALAISIDGPKEIHDCNRVFKNGKGSFDIVYKNIKKIKNIYPDYYNTYISFISVIAPPFDLLSRERFFNQDIFRNRDIRVGLVNFPDISLYDDIPPQQWNQYLKERRIILTKYIDSIIHRKKTSYFAYKVFNNTLAGICNRSKGSFYCKEVVFRICVPGAFKPFIDVEGNIYVCEKLDTIQIGNIKEGFNLAIIERLIKDYFNLCKHLCTNCWAIRFCTHCYASALSKNYIDEENKIINCKLTKRSYANYLRLYTELIKEKAICFSEESKDTI